MRMAEAIGIFDSGVGGLTVLKELRRALPGVKLVYLGDTARTPYGTKSSETVQRYSVECASFLLGRGISSLVVACNTASSHALSQLTELCGRSGGIPVFGTISPAVSEAVSVTQTKRVLVLGTRATVKSGAFSRALNAHGVDVLQQPCPLFVPLVEEGITSGSIVNAAIELYLSQYREAEVDTVILGCTHYPLLRDSLQNFFGPKVSLVDCASTLAATVRSTGDFSDACARDSSDEFYVTDDTGSFSTLAAQILGERTIAVETVSLEG